MFETLMAMDPWTIATFIGASFLLYLTPGAGMMFTIASGVSGGLRAGLAAGAGISLGVLTHVIAAAAGLAVLVAASPVILFILAFLPQFADPAAGPVGQQIILLGVLLGIGGIVTDGACGVFAGLAAERVRKSAGAMNKVSAIIFGGLAARLAIN